MKEKTYPIQFCGNCGIGQKTKEDNPCYCDYYSPSETNRCCSWTVGHFLHTERVVYICSPMRGTELGPADEIIKSNLRKAKAFCEAAVQSHAIPICPHLYFSIFLDDRNPSQRSIGMEMAIELLKKCDEIWVFGEPSEGMKAEIEEAKSLCLPVIYVAQETINTILKKENNNG